MCRTLGSWLEWLTRHLYCWLQGTNLWPLIYSIGNFLSISLQQRIGLQNVLIWLYRMDSFSFLMDLFAVAELIPAYSLTFCYRYYATVFQSEVYAFLTCLVYCISESIINRAILICSDSRAALLALKSYNVYSRVVLQCGNSFQELVLSNIVRLVVSMEIWKLKHLQERDQVRLLWGWSLVFLGTTSVKRREREFIFKSHCASWSLETACR
jgi:hypothetical protein